MPRILPLACAVLLVSACATRPQATTATAMLTATTGNTANGTVTFTKQAQGVWVQGEVRGLAPQTGHGFHIHEAGDCSNEGMAAGGHFNPTAQAHGAHGSGQHHAGDLTSLQADASGVARFGYMSTTISLDEGPTNIVGRALVVHRDPDDFTSQPSGNAGLRIACAVIARN